MKFQISQGFDVFSHEVQQKDLTQFSSVHPTNQVISLFNGLFLVFEKDETNTKLICQEIFLSTDVDVDLIAALPDNSRMIFYSKELHKFIYVQRNREARNGKTSVYQKRQWLKIESAYLQSPIISPNENQKTKEKTRYFRGQKYKKPVLVRVAEKFFDALKSTYHDFIRPHRITGASIGDPRQRQQRLFDTKTFVGSNNATGFLYNRI